MTKLNRKAQSFITYAFLIAVLVAALIAMTGIIRNAIQGKFRQTADTFGQGEQFEPGVTTTSQTP